MQPDETENMELAELGDLRKVLMTLRRNFPDRKDRLDIMVRMADEIVKLPFGLARNMLVRTIEEGLKGLVR